MMQLPKPNLEAMMMQSTESGNQGHEQERHQDTSGVESKRDQTLLQFATGSQADACLSDEAALLMNSVCDQRMESASAMFRSEEEELLESTERALERSLAVDALSDRATESIDQLIPDESSLPSSQQPGGEVEPERGFLPVLKIVVF